MKPDDPPEDSAPQPPDEDEFDRKLRELGERAERLKTNIPFPDPPNTPGRIAPTRSGKPESDPSGYRGLGQGLSIAYSLMGTTLLGFFIGWLIDRQVGGTLWQGLLGILGAAAGVGMTLFLINRFNRME